MEQKRALTGILTSKYRGSRSRKDRSRILEEIDQGQTVELVVGRKNKRRVTKRARTYDEAVKREIVFLWECFDQMCGKRLVAMLPDILPVLVQRGRISRGQEVHQKLFHISAATVDRMLKDERAKRRLKGNTHTRPSSILKSQIPIIISSELNVSEPGHYQIDLVGHDGGKPNGHFTFTLNAVELSCGWMEPRILLDNPQAPTHIKIELRRQKRQIDPLLLKAEISKIQEQLLEVVRRKNMRILYPGPGYPGAKEKMRKQLFGYIYGGLLITPASRKCPNGNPRSSLLGQIF